MVSKTLSSGHSLQGLWLVTKGYPWDLPSWPVLAWVRLALRRLDAVSPSSWFRGAEKCLKDAALHYAVYCLVTAKTPDPRMQHRIQGCLTRSLIITQLLKLRFLCNGKMETQLGGLSFSVGSICWRSLLPQCSKQPISYLLPFVSHQVGWVNQWPSKPKGQSRPVKRHNTCRGTSWIDSTVTPPL